MIPSSPLHTKPLTAVRVCIILLILMGLVRCQTAQALDENGSYVAIGMGIEGCYSLFHGNPDNGVMNWVILTGWLGGYVTAMHYELQETYTLTTDLAAVRAWVFEYCRRNQGHSIAEAAAAYVKAAYPTRQRHAPEVDLPSAAPAPALRPAFPELPAWQQPQPTTPVKRKKR